MAEASERPPLRWVFGAREQRGRFLVYWVRDPLVGSLNFTLHFGLRLLPIDVCSWLGGLMGALAKYRYLESDARARALWQRLRPNEADEASTDAAMGRLWRSVGRTMAEFSVLDRMWPAGRIDTVGYEHVAEAQASGRPIIGMGVHLGNWETIPVAALAHGFRGASIYIPPDNRIDHYIANLARDRLKGAYLKASRNAAFEAIELLKNGQNLLMYVDESIRGRVWAPAFGRRLRPQGNIANIVRIARAANAIIVPLYSVRLDGGARFRVTALPSLKLVDTGDRDADLMANVAMIDALIDPIIRDNLDQWFYALDFEFDG